MSFIDAIEGEIERQLSLVKPELKSKFVYRIIDKAQDKKILATLDKTYYPPLMTIVLDNIERELRTRLREIITHEIIHVLQYRGEEPEAYRKQGFMKFYRE